MQCTLLKFLCLYIALKNWYKQKKKSLKIGEVTKESSEARESWSWASEAKEHRSTLTEAEEKRLKLDSKVKITESGLESRPLKPDLTEFCSSNPNSAIFSSKSSIVQFFITKCRPFSFLFSVFFFFFLLCCWQQMAGWS